jgi:hypothetical protein
MHTVQTITDDTGPRDRQASRVCQAMLGLILLFALVQPVMASHFRSATLSWSPTGALSVDFIAQTSWRRSFGWGCVDISNAPSLTSKPCSGVDGSPVNGDVVNITTVATGDGGSVGPYWLVTAFDIGDDFIFVDLLDRNDFPTINTNVGYTYSAPGNYTASINSCCRVNNSSGASNFIVDTIVNVGSGNSPPNSSQTPIVQCPVNAVCEFNVVANDPDGDPLSFALSSGFTQPGPPAAPNAASINSSGRYVWNTTGAGSAGAQYPTQVIIRDLDGSGQEKSHISVDFLIQLSNNVGSPPVFDSPPAPVCGTTVPTLTDRPVSFTVQASDPDANQVSLNVAGLPAGATMTPSLPTSGNPVLSDFGWTPGLGDVGNRVLSYAASDGTGQQASCGITVRVVAGIADVVVDEDAPDTVIDLNAVFAAFDDGVSNTPQIYSVESNDNPALFSAVTINASSKTLTLSYASNAHGMATLRVRAGNPDGSFTDDTFNVLVNSVFDPPTATLSIDKNVIDEINGMAMLTVQLNFASELDAEVTLVFSGDADAGVDYLATGQNFNVTTGVLTIPAGDTQGVVVISSQDDNTDEPNEVVAIAINGLVNANQGMPSQVMTEITDDDGTPTVALSAANVVFSENGEISVVTATLSNPSSQAVTVLLDGEGEAELGVDFEIEGGGLPQILVPAGELTASLQLNGLDDTDDEATEGFVLFIDSVTNASAAGVQQLTLGVLDDDAGPLDVDGSQSAADKSVPAGSRNVVVMSFGIFNPNMVDALLTSYQVQVNTTNFDLEDLSSARIYLDANGDMLLDENDILLSLIEVIPEDGLLNQMVLPAYRIPAMQTLRFIVSVDLVPAPDAMPEPEPMAAADSMLMGDALMLPLIGFVGFKRRRMLQGVLIGLCVLSLTACGDGGGGGAVSSTVSTDTPVVEATDPDGNPLLLPLEIVDVLNGKVTITEAEEQEPEDEMSAEQ